MKIAILTLPFNDNIGGVLQAYALRRVLLAMGHEVVHLEQQDTSSDVQRTEFAFYRWWYTRRLVKQVLFGNRKLLEENRFSYRQWKACSDIRAFVKRQVPQRKLKKLEDYRAERFDCLIVGSDQIWRPIYYSNIHDAFLSFADADDSIKRIAYAPSFGVEKWEYTSEQTIRCGELLKQFSAVSVREDSGVHFCREKFGVKAQHLLDPTMLLDKKEYMDLVGFDGLSDNRSNLLVSYVLDSTIEKESLIAQICEKKRYRHMLAKNGMGGGIEEWLKTFMAADFIFTDSFHGCVFAILFQKPFIAFGNKKRGLGRFISLLRIFKLENRLILDFLDINALMEEAICWEEVESLLAKERQKSKVFLENAIGASMSVKS